MSVLFTDSGTGADANPIGGSYVTLSGWAALKRVSNTIANAAGSDGDCGARINVTTPNNHYCKIRPSTVGNRDFGCMVRCQSASAGAVLMTDYNATDVEVYVLVAGSFGSFVDRDPGTYQTTSDVYMEAQGTSYLTKIGASTINSFTDATFSSGQGGVFMYDSTARVINVEVGDFVTGYTLALAQGSYTLTGQTVALRTARNTAIAQGSYALSGQSVTLTYSGALKTLAAAQGSYSLSGQTVGLKADRRMAAAQGSYALTGQSVGLKVGRRLAAAQGSYSLSGQSVTLSGPIVGYSLAMGQGTYNLTGSDAAADYAINIGSGSYSLAGQSVGLKYGHKVAIAQGNYAYTGNDVGLRADRRITISQGSYAYSGQDVGLDQHQPAPSLSIDTGIYSLDGMQVSLLYSAMRGDIFRNLPLNWWTKGI